VKAVTEVAERKAKIDAEKLNADAEERRLRLHIEF